MSDAALLLYGYWRSSASYRVRIALNLKQVAYRQQPVHLVRDGGQQHAPEYRAINPQGQVPTLVDGELVLSQSPAILEYLEEKYPEPALLPGDLAGRARVRQLAAVVACDIHTLNNLAVLDYLTGSLRVDRKAGLDSALGRARPRRTGATAGRQSGDRSLLPRRPTEPGRLLPGAAGL